MEFSVLGSGGCMPIPKPACGCLVCREARQRGVPFERGGPSVFLHDENILVDTPADIAVLLNRCDIKSVENLLFTHLDPDHVEGFRVVEQIALDFRTWTAYPEKTINLFLPVRLMEQIKKITTAYGSQAEFYEDSGFIRMVPFDGSITIGSIAIHALPVDRGDQIAFVYVFEKDNCKAVYAPCDIKPFPEHHKIVKDADVLFIQPGLFGDHLKHGFVYPENHISRTTLYAFDETLALTRRINARQVVFIHLEEYWNRSFSDYSNIQKQLEAAVFAYDGMRISVKEKEDK